ncbi:MAG: hypothetical protein GYB32_04470 [Algicola sp.]|nr:hypothetical protein [Algicola sp.]
MFIQNKRLYSLLGVAVFVLLIPLVGMQFSEAVRWTLSDFVLAAILLFGTAFSVELILRTIKKRQSRIILVLSLLTVLALIWIELAVGLFGTPWAGS